MALQDSIVEFSNSIEERILKSRRNARRNYFSAYACNIVAIVASLVGAFAVAIDLFPKTVLSVLAALPGTFLLTKSIFAFEDKSNWYWKKVRKYEAILMRIKYEGFDVSNASKDLRNFEETMEEQYPKFGASPKRSAEV